MQYLDLMRRQEAAGGKPFSLEGSEIAEFVELMDSIHGHCVSIPGMEPSQPYDAETKERLLSASRIVCTPNEEGNGFEWNCEWPEGSAGPPSNW